MTFSPSLESYFSSVNVTLLGRKALACMSLLLMFFVFGFVAKPVVLSGCSKCIVGLSQRWLGDHVVLRIERGLLHAKLKH